MCPDVLSCYLVEKDSAGRASGAVSRLPIDRLPPGDVTIRVAYSSLNYKDALAATGNPGVAKRLPHVPGIDAAGTVVQSVSPDFQVGAEVLVTGYELGAGAWGGWAELIRVPAEWVVPLPTGLSLRESMILGTAGFTAALSLAAIVEHGLPPDAGEIVVTGASGGVGCLAVALLARLGYRVVASTGKPAAHPLLTRLGAGRIIGRDEVLDASDRPLLAARWAGAVDTVGGQTLSSIVRALMPGGAATACGLVGGANLDLTVYPFILRAVQLIGIGSAGTPQLRRREMWRRLAGPWKFDGLETVVNRQIGLAGLDGAVGEILKGEITGRVLVSLQ